ncbi:uncharacterized protein J3D65DRAFT_637400 [Phyllosticta citribraziliensis]|uniref:Uncharacterized protein n=1 Tax=Phyllosticta citribraziliensis TaxID=989973 RepID=A0ABR1L806_9PEZI
MGFLFYSLAHLISGPLALAQPGASEEMMAPAGTGSSVCPPVRIRQRGCRCRWCVAFWRGGFILLPCLPACLLA